MSNPNAFIDWMYYGSRYYLTMQIFQQYNDPLDITDRDVRIILAKAPSQTGNILERSADIIDGPNGLADVTFTPEDAETLLNGKYRITILVDDVVATQGVFLVTETNPGVV